MSLGLTSSITKSGAIGGKLSCSSRVREFQRSSLIQAASGERLAPLGRVNWVDESKATPLPSRSAQIVICVVKRAFFLPAVPLRAVRWCHQAF